MRNLLFVCTGNTCRSPMAEALFRHMVAGQDGWEIASAGIHASEGDQMSPNTARVLRSQGIDVPPFSSRPLTSDLIEKATHIIVMGRHHFSAIENFFPEAATKLYLVSEFSPDDGLRDQDIPDPFGGSLKAYEETYRALSKLLPNILMFVEQTTPESKSSEIQDSTGIQRLIIGADHGGYELKNALVAHLRNQGHEVKDLGTDGPASVDYPDFAAPVAQGVLSGAYDAGILVCTSGIGMSIAANRFPGIQASVISDVHTARITREHNQSNVLCLGQSQVSEALGAQIVDAWLSTPFAGGRHQRRVCKMNGSPSSLINIDPEIAQIIAAEEVRQSNNIELIASENFTSRAVQAAQGSCLTNKYAEGYPGKRWYGGCEEVDKIESLAIERLKKIYGAEFANVQPHSGSQANTAVYFSVLQPGDRILTMDLSHGGHLTHGHQANFSGKFYEVCHYGVDRETEKIDYDHLQSMAEEFKPKMITAGASAYPRVIDFERMGQIARSVGAYLFVDMAHIAGLVAAGVHPNPVPHADFITSTTHKSLRGPRGGIILTNNPDLAKKINAMVFPGIQGGPLMHVIAAKAVCFHEALQPEFKAYQQQVIKNTAALASALNDLGYRIVSGGTDNHLCLVDLRPQGLNGNQASVTLDHAGITVNKNTIPFDTGSAMKPSGIRLGSPAVTTRGMKEAEMVQIASFIHRALVARDDAALLASIKEEVQTFNRPFPLP